MRVIVNLKEDIINFFKEVGIICDETDGATYYNNNQWLRVDKNGVATMEDFKDLPDSVKSVHLKYINQPATAESKEIAIGFAEWIKGNGYTDYGRGGKEWHTIGSYGHPKYTIEQLYNIFLQSLKIK